MYFQKFSGDAIGSPIQTFYLPITGDVVNLIDTQIRKGIEYTYQVSVYVAILGLKYEYELVDKRAGSHRFESTYRIKSSSEVIVCNVPVFVEKVRIKENSPLSPQVKFYNNSNSENSLKIYLDKRIGSEMHKFNFILDNDSNSFVRSEVNSIGETNFESDEMPVNFEIFRLPIEPKDYKDFIPGYKGITRKNYNSDAIVYKDTITPNQKYYYMFRTITETRMISNPSPIYEVELIKDASKTIASIKIYKLPEKEQFDFTKSFRSLMQIRPSINHTLLNQKEYNVVPKGPNEVLSGQRALDQYYLGDSEVPIWGRKFKIRVKSNDSGKIIDFNVNFDLIKEKK